MAKPTNVSRKPNIGRVILHEALFALAIALFFVVLVMIAMGYRLRRSESGLPVVERTALLRVGSYPTSAHIFLDGADTSRKTTLSSQRLVISAGSHSLKVTRDGYQTWQHDFTVAEADITWFDYIQLIPTDRSGDVVQSVPSTTEQAIWRSPLGERALVFTPARKSDPAQINIISLSPSSTKNTVANLTKDMTQPQLIAWAKDDGMAFLCANECFLLDLDHSRATAVDLPIKRNETLLDIAFINTRTLIAATSERAFIYDTTTKTAQDLPVAMPNENLPEHLVAATSDLTLLYYIATTPDSSTNAPKTTYHLATVNTSGAYHDIYTDDTPFEFTATHYLNDTVLVIANRSRLKIYFGNASSLFGGDSEFHLQDEYDLPTERSPIIADGRFIIVENGFAVDLERHTAAAFDNNCSGTTWQKLSNAQLYCPNNNELLIKDFDDTNQMVINLPDGVSAISPASLVNRRTLYYWTNEDSTNTLQLRQLKL